MAGANAVPKHALVNREAQFDPLQTLGVQFYQRDVLFLNNPAAPIAASRFLQDLLLTSPGGIYTGPSANQLFLAMSQKSVPQAGNRYSQIIENTTALPASLSSRSSGSA